ncbi:MAG TPA: glycosyltransferase [Flavitalea sp.]|nr:glycosyltransferase [Flavitalea sp.]
MRIAFYGNICNNFYTLAKALRSVMGIDAHLYLNHKADMQNRPESDDPRLKDNYPDWIHFSEKWDPVPFFKRLDRTFINELNKYDIVFLSEFGVMLSPFLKTKTLFYATGGDLTQLPFPSKFRHNFKNLADRAKWEYFGWLQRRGIRNCTKILCQPFFPFANALQELKVAPERISNCYFPILMNTDLIAFNENALNEIDAYNRGLLAPYKFIIFHPSRINLDESVASVHSGQWKGNDNLLKGLAIFIDKYKATDVCIAMPDRVSSPDIPKAKKIIQDLGIENNIVWLKPPSPEGFPRKELVNFYSVSDIVADEFATGWFGSIVVEGMACQKPVFCYVNEDVMKQLYPWHPIVSAREPAQIADLIAEFYFDREKCRRQGALSLKWALEFHSIKSGSGIYINNFKNDLKDIFKLN